MVVVVVFVGVLDVVLWVMVVDLVVCVWQFVGFVVVGQYYWCFDEVVDDEVMVVFVGGVVVGDDV